MANSNHFPRPRNDFSMLMITTLLLMTFVIAKGGTPTAIQYPPETVRGVWGEDVLLQFAINGTQPDDSIVIQGPNPQTGSDRLDHIFERGTGELVPHQPFEDYTVAYFWYDGVTNVNLTIHDLRDKVVGTFRLSMTVLFTGADINVSGWSGDNMTFSTPSHPDITLEGTRGTNVTNGSYPGPTQQSGGLGAGYIILVVFAVVAPIAILGFCIYKRMTPGAGQQASHARQQGEYDTVPTRDGDHHDNGFMPGKEALELKEMGNRRDKDIENGAGSSDSAQNNGPIPV